MKPEPCSNCKNWDFLYWRKYHRVCANCAALNPAWSRVREGHPNFMDPINQPNALGTATTKRERCVHCGAYTYSRYRTRRSGASGEKIIFACSWGHAGFWMDSKIEESKLAEGEAYVRESLGLK